DVQVNGQSVADTGGGNHVFSYDIKTVPLNVLQSGDNTVSVFNATDHHGTEVLWPGPGLMVRHAGAPPLPPELPFYDDFQDGEDTNPRWERWSGTWTVEAGEYHQSESADNRFSVAGNPAWTDYFVSVDVRLSGQGTQGSGLMFRVVDPNNLYLFEVNAGTDDVTLWRCAGGAWQSVATGTAPQALAVGTWYSLRVEAEGASLRTFVDSTLVAQADDATHATGRIGLNAGEDALFDDVAAEALPLAADGGPADGSVPDGNPSGDPSQSGGDSGQSGDASSSDASVRGVESGCTCTAGTSACARCVVALSLGWLCLVCVRRRERPRSTQSW
ncbi:family 16 glycoside hydrolase, partial [Myxococcota bacterium]